MDVKTALEIIIALTGFPAGVLVAYMAKDEVRKSFTLIHWTKILTIIIFLLVYALMNDREDYLLYLFSSGFVMLFFFGAEYIVNKLK